MGSLCIFSGNEMLSSRNNKMNIQAKEHNFVRTYSILGCSLLPCCCGSVFFRPTCSYKGLYLFCNQEVIKSDLNGSRRCSVIGMEKQRNNFMKRRFSLRLRPRLWLFSSRLKRFSVRSLLNDLRTFVRKNVKTLVISISFTLILGLCYFFLNLSVLPSPKIKPYSDLVTSLQNGYVSKVLFEEGSHRIYYNMHCQAPSNLQTLESGSFSTIIDSINENAAKIVTPRKMEHVNVLRKLLMRGSSTPEWQYFTRKIDGDESFILSLMRDTKTSYSSAPPSVIMSLRAILVTVLTLWIPLIPLMWLLYRQLSSANSPARKRKPTSQDVCFDDVEGVDGAKMELMEIILCLQGVRNYNKLGAKLPRGVLLIGPPGTGKTLLARAVAGEAGVPFFSVSASEFVELFVGRGAARIRDLFKIARKCAPSIIFIDELDAVGGKRGRSFNDERDQTLNQLLTEMDGFETNMNVVVIAATNRQEALDPALCRPGRFSRKVLVGEPDEEGRRKILNLHFRGVALEEETSEICDFIASLTQGFVGADLANVVNEAALLAARRGGESVRREDILEAIERAKYGINYAHPPPQGVISKEIGKLFPWMASLLGKTEPKQDGLQYPSGYQTFSRA